VGTRGLVQLVGGLLTAAIALGVLCYLNWRLTVIAILILGCFGGGMAMPSRSCGRCSGTAASSSGRTGRLGETLGGIRIVKAYRAERSERLVFTKGANTLFRNIAMTMTGNSRLALRHDHLGAIGILMITRGRTAPSSRAAWDAGEFVMYLLFIGLRRPPR